MTHVNFERRRFDGVSEEGAPPSRGVSLSRVAGLLLTSHLPSPGSQRLCTVPHDPGPAQAAVSGAGARVSRASQRATTPPHARITDPRAPSPSRSSTARQWICTPQPSCPPIPITRPTTPTGPPGEEEHGPSTHPDPEHPIQILRKQETLKPGTVEDDHELHRHLSRQPPPPGQSTVLEERSTAP